MPAGKAPERPSSPLQGGARATSRSSAGGGWRPALVDDARTLAPLYLREPAIGPQKQAGKEREMTERTLVLVKPDAMQRGLAGEVLGRFERRGLKIVAMRMLQIDEALAAQATTPSTSASRSTRRSPTSSRRGPSSPPSSRRRTPWRSPARRSARRDPAKAAPGSIRGDFGINMGRNMVHGSDSLESAAREVALFFEEKDIVELGAQRRGLDRREVGRLLLEADDGDAAAPERFEVVVGARLGVEEVDDDVAEVEEHPAGVGVAFAADAGDAAGAEVAVERVDEGLHLAGVRGRGDDEIVGETRNLANVE